MAYPSDLVRTKNWGTEQLTDSDLEGQFDLIIAWVMAALDSTAGHGHEGTSNKAPKINVGTGLTVTNQALGDILYASSASAFARLAGNTTTTKKFLTQTGDGAASAAPAWDTIDAADAQFAGEVVQVVNTQTGAVATGTTAIPNDDSIPQITEGDQYMTLAITPQSATNKLKVDVVFIGNFPDFMGCIALFNTDIHATNALAVGYVIQNAGWPDTICFSYYVTSPGITATTFRVRAGGAGTTTFNGTGGARKFGGVSASSITITEIKV